MLRLTLLLCLSGSLLLAACGGGDPPPANNSRANQPVNPSTPTPAPSAEPQIVTVAAEEARLAAGGRGEAVVRLDIADGWHVNANPPSDKFYIGTEVTAEPQAGITPGAPAYPRGLTKKFEFSRQPLAVYEGRVEVRLPLRAEASAAKGRHTLRARVRYQPCNDRECLQPRTVEAEIAVNVS